MDEVKTFQECDHSQKHTEEAKTSITVISTQKQGYGPKQITPTQGEDSIQSPTQIAEEEDTLLIGTKKETSSQECDDVQKHANCTTKAEASECDLEPAQKHRKLSQ